MFEIKNNYIQKLPLVSIGLPVFNGEATIRNVLESLTMQTFTEFEIIISNNSSTDKTEQICLEYAKIDNRIRYYRQDKNYGPLYNFYFVLEKSIADYFMWAAADDIHSINYIELNYEFLEKNKEYVASICPVKFINDSSNINQKKMGDRSLEDDKFYKRIKDFFGIWHVNAALYSLIRTKIIKNFYYKGSEFLGIDWIIVIFLARNGKLKRLEIGYLELGNKGISNSNDVLRQFRKSWIEIFIPFMKLSIYSVKLLKGSPLEYKLLIIKECIKLNYFAVKIQLIQTIYKYYKKIKKKIII